jgi:hypothetical protein
MDLATTLGACVGGLEMCGNILIEGVYAHRAYPAVGWDVAAARMQTGDLVVARGSYRCWGDVAALVLRDVSGVLYAQVGGRDLVPLGAWVRQQVSRGAQCCWRPLRVADQARGAAHPRVAAMSRTRADPYGTLLRAGVLQTKTTAVDLVNCNTAPGHRYDGSMAVQPTPTDLDRAD